MSVPKTRLRADCVRVANATVMIASVVVFLNKIERVKVLEFVDTRGWEEMEMGTEVRRGVASSSPQPFPCLALVCLGQQRRPRAGKLLSASRYITTGDRRT